MSSDQRQPHGRGPPNSGFTVPTYPSVQGLFHAPVLSRPPTIPFPISNVSPTFNPSTPVSPTNGGLGWNIPRSVSYHSNLNLQHFNGPAANGHPTPAPFANLGVAFRDMRSNSGSGPRSADSAILPSQSQFFAQLSTLSPATQLPFSFPSDGVLSTPYPPSGLAPHVLMPGQHHAVSGSGVAQVSPVPGPSDGSGTAQRGGAQDGGEGSDDDVDSDGPGSLPNQADDVPADAEDLSELMSKGKGKARSTRRCSASEDFRRDTPPHHDRNPNRYVTRAEYDHIVASLNSISLILHRMEGQPSGRAGGVTQSFHNSPNSYTHVPRSEVTQSFQNSLGVGVDQPPSYHTQAYSPVSPPYNPFFNQSLNHSASFSVDIPRAPGAQVSTIRHVPSSSEIEISNCLLHAYITNPPPAVPSTTSLPILQGRENFAQWSEAAVGLIRNLGLNPWICGPTAGGTPHVNPNFTPVYPPSLPQFPSPVDYQLWQVFWARDGVASVILTSRLSQSVASSLCLDPVSGEQRTAREILHALRTNYGVADFSTASTAKDILFATPCKGMDSVRDFVAKWKRVLTTLEGVRYPISWAETIQKFVALLPDDPYWLGACSQAASATAMDPHTLIRSSWDYFASHVLQMDAERRNSQRARYHFSQRY
ncbi:hypothetical protein V5O48_018586 [Marasmius crinis-equi]|uniref:Retrotransposon Copia-like N-terminal domain-containing protein n=1 Tax=Marasmius crinis-equi TaxID=585013 RepID=A0ABR3EKR9_9AGAR